MPTECCVPLCTNKGGHKFPRDGSIAKAWLVAIRRDQWNPAEHKHAVVCYNHFSPDDYKDWTYTGKRNFRKGIMPVRVASTISAIFYVLDLHAQHP